MFYNFSLGKIHRTVVDAWQTTGIYLVLKKKKTDVCTALLALYYKTLPHRAITEELHIVIPFVGPLHPLNPALTPHAPAIRPHHETSIKPLYLFY